MHSVSKTSTCSLSTIRCSKLFWKMKVRGLFILSMDGLVARFYVIRVLNYSGLKTYLASTKLKDVKGVALADKSLIISLINMQECHLSLFDQRQLRYFFSCMYKAAPPV